MQIWAESEKSALPICNHSQILYQFLTFTQNLKRSHKIHVSFNCQKCNASVHLDEPSDIAYLIRLAREESGLYAKLASRDDGLQGYVETVGEFN